MGRRDNPPVTDAMTGLVASRAGRETSSRKQPFMPLADCGIIDVLISS